VSAKRRSSRRSVSSKASPPDSAPLFIDRDAWSHKLGQALDDSGIAYVAHRQRFDHDSPDVEWIEMASREKASARDLISFQERGIGRGGQLSKAMAVAL